MKFKIKEDVKEVVVKEVELYLKKGSDGIVHLMGSSDIEGVEGYYIMTFKDGMFNRHRSIYLEGLKLDGERRIMERIDEE